MAEDRVFKTDQDLIKTYIFWSAPYAHLTPKQRRDGFAETYRITPEEIAALDAFLRALPPTPPPPARQFWRRRPKPPTPPRPPTPPTPKPPRLPRQPTVKPELVIETTPYPKWWKNSKAGSIGIQGAGEQLVILKATGYKIYISTIVLTVSAETNITFEMGAWGTSGSMDFGGENEPRGIVIAMGNSPLPCGAGPFKITSDGATANVGGFVVYYFEKETIKKW